MTFCIITDIVSPHQMPLAYELARHLGPHNFRYIATSVPQLDRGALGWGQAITPEWILQPAVQELDRSQADQWAENADVILCGHRELGLFERRSRSGKMTLYMSERWFKPPTGMARLCYPLYFRMAWRVWRLLRSPHFHYLPIGIYAAQDMCRLVSLFELCSLPLSVSSLYAKQRLWGYFIGPSDVSEPSHDRGASALEMLWFGRFMKLKRIDLVIKAVKDNQRRPGPRLELKIIGSGGEETVLKDLVKRLDMEDVVEFSPPKPIAEIRREIRDADICVVTSNAQEGWGVAVNEGLIEGRCVIASDATGAGATLIQDGVNGLLFKSGSCEDLARQLQRVREDRQLRDRLAQTGKKTMLDEWAPTVVAERLVSFSESLVSGCEPPQWASGPLSVV